MAEAAEKAAAVAVKEWRVRQTEQALDRQRSQVETAKLLVTFALAVGATLVATALQVGRPTALDVWATVALAAAFLGVVAVIVLDRLKEPNPDYVDAQAAVNGWNDVQRLAALEILSVAAQGDGDDVVRIIKGAATLQVAVTVAASVLAALSLLTT